MTARGSGGPARRRNGPGSPGVTNVPGAAGAPGDRTKVWKLLGRVVVAVAGVAFFAVMVVASTRSTSSLASGESVAAHLAVYRQSQCLTQEARRELPRGAEVAIENSTNTYAGQLVTQYLTGWAVPVTRPGLARWTVELVTGRGGCSGEHLVVRPS